ncbi:MAG TPA: flagellar hook-length control protein FliK [Caulobacteraceae bacterium]|nr:flagellar hook-length control protein FliK [Caulobacteraceae bacterium]
MQAAVAHIAAKAQTAAPSGGSDSFGAFGFAPANDPTASDASAQGPAAGVADAFTQALAAMMGITAPAAAIAPQAPTTSAASQSVGSSTAGAKATDLPLLPQLPAGATAASNITLKGAAPQAASQASANAAAAKVQTPQTPQTQGAASTANQGSAAALTAFRANISQTANGPGQTATAPPPAPPLSAQSATAAILTPPAQTAPALPKLASGVPEKAESKENTAGSSPSPLAAITQKPPAPTPPAGAPSGEGDADLGGHRPSGAEVASQRPAPQAASSSDNSSFASAMAQTAAPAQAAAPSATLATAGAAIVSQIAEQTIKNLSGKSARFDVALEPAGLGQVNVKIQIDQTGQVSAAFSFDNPHSAAAAKSQSSQLQQALEQAGFNVAHGGLSFDVGGQGAGNARPDSGQTFASSNGSSMPEPAPASAPAPTSIYRVRASGVDITI